MAEEWFETVAIAQERAKRRLPKSVYSSLISASEKGITVADNVGAFSELGFATHVIGAQEKRDLSTTVMGQDISLPVIISPTGVQAVHPDGEVAVARAAAARGTAMGLSSFASKPIEEVIAPNPKVFFQVYWLGGRDAIAERVERARQAGAVGLIVTTDWTFSHGRDWGSPKIPEEMNLLTILRLSPEAIVRPRWLWKFGKTLRPPDLRVPNQGRRGEPGPPFFAAYGEWMGTPPPTRGDIGVEPRRQQPRRHARVDSRPAPDSRGGRWTGRGIARRWHPARKRRRQGGGAGGARGDDRPRLPVGPRRGRAGRRRERPRHPARRHRLGADRSGALLRS